MPLISVVIPCYNAELFLAETVESVLLQTFTDYEIILIDDGSTDGTLEVIKSFGDRLRSEEGVNKGASAARNRGTQLAQGKLIQYVDADDLLMPDALASRVNAMQSENADVAYSDWQRLEEKKGEFQPGAVISRKIEDVHPDAQIALFTDFWAPPAAILYSREIVKAIGGWNESLPIIQDARFFLDAALMGAKFVYVPGVGTQYRVHKSNSLSRRDASEFFKDIYRNACQVEAFWQDNGGLTKPRIRALIQVYDLTARSLFMADEQMFKENLHRLYQLEPRFRPTWPKLAGIALPLGKHRATILLKLLGKPPVNL